MDVLGENRRVLRLIRRLWPEAEMKVASGSVEVTAMINRAEYLRNKVLVAHH
jgi:acetyltransferase